MSNYLFQLCIQIRIGVMTFSDDAQRKFALDEYRTRNDAVTAVRAIPYRMGRTNTADAIRFARTNMFSPGNIYHWVVTLI